MPLIPLDKNDQKPEEKEKRTDLAHTIAHAAGISHNCYKEDAKKDENDKARDTIKKDDEQAIKKS